MNDINTIRLGLMRDLVEDRIRNGYTLEDFTKEYRAISEKDKEEFQIVYAEIMGK